MQVRYNTKFAWFSRRLKLISILSYVGRIINIVYTFELVKIRVIPYLHCYFQLMDLMYDMEISNIFKLMK